MQLSYSHVIDPTWPCSSLAWGIAMIHFQTPKICIKTICIVYFQPFFFFKFDVLPQRQLPSIPYLHQDNKGVNIVKMAWLMYTNRLFFTVWQTSVTSTSICISYEVIIQTANWLQQNLKLWTSNWSGCRGCILATNLALTKHTKTTLMPNINSSEHASINRVEYFHAQCTSISKGMHSCRLE